MVSLRRVCVPGVLAFMSVSIYPALAVAADYIPASYLEGRLLSPVEFGSGWYLRGDIGIFTGKAAASYDVGGTTSAAFGNWGSNPSISVGAGYVFNDQFRADGTLTYRDGISLAGSSGFFACGGAFTGDCRTDNDADLQSLAVEFNGYWTPFKLGSLSPYVGAGIGLAAIRWDDTVLDRCRLDPGENCSLATNGTPAIQDWIGTGTRQDSYTTVALTASVMAGVDYRINDYWIADLGYKYTRMIDIGLNDVGHRPDLDELSIHEFKIGMRYEIW